MSANQEKIFAFIDSQNLNLNVRQLGWRLDFRRFRIYLKEKYSVEKAFLFIGYIANNKDLYDYLRKSGFIIIFKPSVKGRDGKIKGNCDAELVLHAMIQFSNFDKAIIVSGDGDFFCLVDYLYQQKKLLKIIIPDKYRYSSLLKKIPGPYRAYMNDLRERLSDTKYRP